MIADPTAALWYDQDWPVLEEISVLQRHGLRPGATTFEIGAHQAVVALLLAQCVGRTGTVLAVEAGAHNVRVARKNIDRNAAPQILLEHAAASDHPGWSEFGESLNGKLYDGRAPWAGVRIRAVTVDGLATVYGEPDVLFIDVEGAEARVLRGAAGTLLRSQPDCFVEVHPGDLARLGDSVQDVLSSFAPSVYTLTVATEEDRTFRPLADAQRVLSDRFFLLALAGATGKRPY